MSLFKVAIGGTDSLIEELERYSAQNIVTSFEGAVSNYLQHVRQRFLAGEDTGEHAWMPLRYPRKSGNTQKPLFDTGTLFHSIQAYRVSQTSWGVGTNVPYAKQHQEGLYGLPKREFLGVSFKDEARVFQIFEAGLGNNG